MKPIKFVCRTKKNRNLYFCDYSPVLDRAIQNFRSVRTVHVIKGVCYIQSVSIAFFLETLSNPALLKEDRKPISYTVITTLI